MSAMYGKIAVGIMGEKAGDALYNVCDRVRMTNTTAELQLTWIFSSSSEEAMGDS